MKPGDLIKAARTALALSQQELADRGGIDRVRISNFENGKNDASGSDARRGLSRGFGVTLDDLDEFLEGKMPLERFVEISRTTVALPQRRSAAAQAFEAGEDPIAERGAAIELMRGVVDDETLRSVRSLNLKTDVPLTVEDWLQKIEESQKRRNEIRARLANPRPVLAVVPEEDDGPDVSPEALARAAEEMKKKKGRKR